MKNLITAAALFASVTPVAAESIRATVEDIYINVSTQVPYIKQECQDVQTPVYGTVTRQGDAAGSALLGMLIGGAIGKGVTGKDDGAAAGAVMGGLIGADQGSKPKTEQVITGYKTERQCNNITYYRNEKRRQYNYSILRFKVDGKQYETTFEK